MSSPMMPPRGGPGGGMQQGGMRGMESVMNPTDVAMKSGRGELRPDMTIREFYQTLGLDVDRNTVADMTQKLQGQAQMANPMSKMQAMAGRGGAPRPPMGQPPMGQPQGPPPADIESLLGRMK